MKIAVTGSYGFIGSNLLPILRSAGHDVYRLVRTSTNEDIHTTIKWNATTGTVDRKKFQDIDAVIHLAGEPIWGRWSQARRECIINSRVAGTRMFVESLTGMDTPPKILLAASAVGYYGDRGDTVLNENMACGTGFLSELCMEWEAATQLAATSNTRVVNLRFGQVLSPYGGMLAKQFPWFKMGLGGKLGNGKQYMSWISIADACRAILHILERQDLQGPVNMVTPNSIRNREFTRSLARVLHRPAILPRPAFLLKALFGQRANELLLSSTRAVPDKLLQSGFEFKHPTVEKMFEVSDR